MGRASLVARAWALAFATVLAGCQTAPTSNLASGSPHASGTAPSGQAASPASTSSPVGVLPPVPPTGPLTVTIAPEGNSTIVSLWSGDSLKADVRAADRSGSVPSCHPYQATYLPCVSTSNSRAYYLDGDTSVRYLAAGQSAAPCAPSGCTFGTSGDVTHVPGGATEASAFAVSPNDERIAVSVFSFKPSASGPVPTGVRLYVENLIGGGGHVEIFTSNSLWVWPVGWHDGKLVVAAGSPTKPVEGPYGAVTEFHLVDPTTGNRLQALGSPTCPVVPALLSPAGTVCVASDGSLRSQYWSGPNVTFVANYAALKGGAMLSLDGTRVAVCCADTSLVLEVIDAPALGGAVKPVAQARGYQGGGGWIDGTHISYRPSTNDHLAWVDTTSPYGPSSLPFVGEFAGRVPGGI